MDKRKLIVIGGPTAAGKTSSSIALAREIGGEIISCDSMQVYRMMDIGSAKIRQSEMQGIPHHLVDVLDPKERFDVTVFQRLAKEAIEAICERGKIPIMVGGTGFYLQAVLYDVDFTETREDALLRESLYRYAKEYGAEALHERLFSVDPESAEAIPAGNVKRVARAIEFYELSGQKISEHNDRERKKEPPYDYRFFVLNLDREKLYRRIDERVDSMMESGLLSEVERLKEYGCTRDMTSMQGLGYKQLFAYLEGETTLDEAVGRIKRETRHFAKRQITWFKREPRAEWIDIEKENLIDAYRNGLHS